LFAQSNTNAISAGEWLKWQELTKVADFAAASAHDVICDCGEGDHGGRCDRSDSGITAYFISYGPALGFKSSAYGPPDHIGWPT